MPKKIPAAKVTLEQKKILEDIPSITDLVKKKIEKISYYLGSQAGKPKVNPFIWKSKVLDPLIMAFSKGDIKAGEAILALPDEPDISA